MQETERINMKPSEFEQEIKRSIVETVNNGELLAGVNKISGELMFTSKEVGWRGLEIQDITQNELEVLMWRD